MPKVTFSAAAPAARDALPPMDVAVFVGFAASGPIDVPVAVHDPVRFEEIFGDDLLLAYTGRGEPVYAYLGPCVRAFFRSGGRKCYVVRVAGDDAEANGFLVPGLMAVSGEPPGFFASLLRARSQGAWSDPLRVGAVLESERYAGCRAQLEAGRFEIVLEAAGAPLPVEGDLVLVELARPGALDGLGATTRLYLAAERVERTGETGSSGAFRSRLEARVSGGEYWFEVVTGSPAAGPRAAIARLLPALGPVARQVGQDAAGGEPGNSAEPDRPGGIAARWFPPAGAGVPHRIVLPFDAALVPGALIELEVEEGEREGGALAGEEGALAGRFLAGVTGVRPPSREELEAVRALGGDRWLTVTAREVLAPLDRDEGRSRLLHAPAESLRAERLAFGLWTKDGRGRTAELSRLGFSPLSARYVGYLPSDEALFGVGRTSVPAGDGPRPGAELWGEVDHPRFPLAAWFGAENANERAAGFLPCYLPIGMERERRIEATAGRVGGPGGAGAAGDGAARRNGLLSFSAGLFLDPDLAGVPAEALADAAFHKQYVLGRPLRRLHAAMALEDASLLAVPDAVHAPWEEEPPSPVRILKPPRLHPLESSGSKATATWSSVDPAADGPVEYLLEEASDPVFSEVTRRLRTSDRYASWEEDAPCPRVRYYRVRAEERGLPGPWSNTEVALLPRRAFEACEAVLPPPPVPPAPVLEAPAALPDGRWRFAWSAVSAPAAPQGPEGEGDPQDAAVEYLLVQGEAPDFRDERVVHRGSAAEASLFLPASAAGGVLYFRVRAEAPGAAGPWSNTVALVRPAPGGRRLVVREGAGEAEAERVHATMLNLCAARSDMTCVLTTPRGFDSARAAAHAARLSGAFGPGRDRALGYGALYYPWTWAAQPGRGVRLIPPDGSVAGLIARRATERGAWVAPANVVVPDVVALEFDLAQGDLEALYSAGFNLIAREAGGFTLVGADTLSRDGLVRPLSVRRLLILIRKVALREGQDMVFDPNDEALRRRIRRRFESIFSQLFMRGAFAGRTPEEAFRVAVEAPRGLAASADLGRVVVDLCFAPSRPLEFVRVRLVQAEGGGLRLAGGD